MKRISLAACALLVCGVVHAQDADVCGVVSAYDLRIQPGVLVFHRDTGEIRMQNGQLVADGRRVSLSAADSRRIQRYESEVRALVPQVRGIAMDAVRIASRGVNEVISKFDGPGASQAVRRVNDVAEDLLARLATSNDTAEWDEDQLQGTVEGLADEIVPMIAGDIAASAVQAAVSGDLQAADRLRQRVEDLPATLEQTVELRTRSLQARARALCPRIAALDLLEAEFVSELPGGRRLDLIEIER